MGEGPSVKAGRRRPPGEGQREKVYQRRPVGEGLLKKADGRSSGKGRRDKVSRKRSRTKVPDEGLMIAPCEGSAEKASQ